MGLRFSTVTVSVTAPSAFVATQRWGTVTLSVLFGGYNAPTRKFSHVGTSVLGKRPLLGQAGNSTHLFLSHVNLSVLATRTPDFRYGEMLQYEVFPDDISFNSIGSHKFVTDVVVVDSGADDRNARWDQAIHEYDVAYGVRTMEQLHAMKAFHMAMRGRLYSFLYLDHVDHTSTLAYDIEARKAPDPGPFDQVLGVGDDLTKIFQLIKTYPAPGLTIAHSRKITKPKVGTVRVAVNNQEVVNWTVDRMTGLVTFTPRISLANLNGMNLVYTSGNSFQVVSPRVGEFLPFMNNDRVIMSGWANAQNNWGEEQVCHVTWKSADNTTMTLNCPDRGGFIAETGRNGVTMTVLGHPKPGEIVTAGFIFYVPVRFDTDRLPISLEEYGIGGAADVKLIEVRPRDE